MLKRLILVLLVMLLSACATEPRTIVSEFNVSVPTPNISAFMPKVENERIAVSSVELLTQKDGDGLLVENLAYSRGCYAGHCPKPLITYQGRYYLDGDIRPTITLLVDRLFVVDPKIDRRASVKATVGMRTELKHTSDCEKWNVGVSVRLMVTYSSERDKEKKHKKKAGTSHDSFCVEEPIFMSDSTFMFPSEAIVTKLVSSAYDNLVEGLEVSDFTVE